MTVEVRPGRGEDLERLQDVEREAGVLFVDAGMPEIAEHDPPSVEELSLAEALFVATEDELVVGYAWVEVVDGHAHLEQLSVVPSYGRRGVGTALLDAVVDWARARGDHEVTLTTFRDIAFNAPMYERRGFVALADDDRGPDLVALMGEEAAHGLEPRFRVAMRRAL